MNLPTVTINIDGEPITKFIDVVSKGIGTAYKPRAIRKEADAEAYASEVRATAEAKALLIAGDAKLELLERAKNRIIYQEIQRQENIENIIELALPKLDEEVSDEEVDPDWIARFFKNAEDVSNEQIQEIWAKILAGEISKPGLVSNRTLEVVSNISKLEAEAFNTACSLVSQYAHIFKIDNKTSFEQYGLSYTELMMLKEASLIHDSDFLNVKYPVITTPDHGTFSVVQLDSHCYSFRSKLDTPLISVKLQQIALTTAGSEICKLINADTNEQYFKDLLESMQKDYVIELMPQTG